MEALNGNQQRRSLDCRTSRTIAQRKAKAWFLARMIPPQVDLRDPVAVTLALMAQGVRGRDIEEVYDAVITCAHIARIEEFAAAWSSQKAGK